MGFKIRSASMCMYCGGKLRLRYKGVYHPFKRDHGPFDICICIICGSLQTHPLPSPNSLTALYESFRDGLPNLHRTITADDPQLSLYGKCVSQIRILSGKHDEDMFKWLDIGAGGGEFSALMAKAYPKSFGVATDLHTCPTLLTKISTVDWLQIDINKENFSDRLPQADLVLSISVWEHVLHPDLFVINLLRLVRPGGMLYLLCPNCGSIASRLLGRNWPYFTPGEHLSMPTPSGAIYCLQRGWDRLHGKSKEQSRVSVRPVMLPYTLRYVFRRLGANSLGKLLPKGLGFSLPSGALQVSLVRQSNTDIGDV